MKLFSNVDAAVQSVVGGTKYKLQALSRGAYRADCADGTCVVVEKDGVQFTVDAVIKDGQRVAHAFSISGAASEGSWAYRLFGTPSEAARAVVPDGGSPQISSQNGGIAYFDNSDLSVTVVPDEISDHVLHRGVRDLKGQYGIEKLQRMKFAVYKVDKGRQNVWRADEGRLMDISLRYHKDGQRVAQTFTKLVSRNGETIETAPQGQWANRFFNSDNEAAKAVFPHASLFELHDGTYSPRKQGGGYFDGIEVIVYPDYLSSEALRTISQQQLKDKYGIDNWYTERKPRLYYVKYVWDKTGSMFTANTSLLDRMSIEYHTGK